RQQRAAVGEEGWDSVVEVSELTAVSERSDDLQRALSATPTASRTAGLAFGLVVSSFPWSPDETADRLKEVVDAASAGGFSSLWVQDHLIQIPQVGRRWEPMLEGLATTAWLAGISGDIAIGTLVANTSLRNPAHLAKIIATIDVLSGGRARCGLGAGWWRDEFIAYGLELPPVRERLDRLEDALRLLPLMWAPGTVDFDGRTVVVKGAECYPRPIQEHVPIVVGGQGPQRTLKLAATYADGVNLRGDPDVVTKSVDALLAHCHAAGRDPHEIEISHMSWPLVGTDRADAARYQERFRRGEAATVDEHAGRIEALAAAGVGTFLFAPADLTDGAEAVERLVPLLKRMR
ncbi:MAG: LLM class flavin-dependent oxidoreductase, partial [Candidatus Limnocylindria bacterium]